jgi:hypothetical protein
MQEADRAAAQIRSTTHNLAEVLASKEPPKPPEAEPSKETDPLPQSDVYFERPEQLLQILANLDEQNLFLIQNAQEVEEARDAIEATFKYAVTPHAGKHLLPIVQQLAYLYNIDVSGQPYYRCGVFTLYILITSLAPFYPPVGSKLYCMKAFCDKPCVPHLVHRCSPQGLAQHIICQGSLKLIEQTT